MKRNKLLLSLSSAILVMVAFMSSKSDAQSVLKLPDPDGIPVTFMSDSLFAYKHRFMDHMVMYAIDGDGLRNVMVTNAQESHWAFDTGKPLSAGFTRFLWVSSNQVLFAIDSVWYKANDDFTEIVVFNDNRDTANPYIFLFAADIYTNTWIVAMERITGERVLLSYNSVSEQYHRYQDLNGSDIRVIQWVSLNEGFAFDDTYFIGSIYDDNTGTWSVPGLYRIKTVNHPELLLELGERSAYSLDAFTWIDSYVIDYPEGSDPRVFEYHSGMDSLIEATDAVLDGDRVLEISHLKSAFYDDDSPPFSTTMTLWKGQDATNQIYYLLRRDDGFLPEWEIDDIEGSGHVDMLIASYFLDSIYYYDYDDPLTGLVRMNFFNGNTIKEPTAQGFSPNHELFAWEGKMYYAKYDAVSDKVYARLQDFDDYSNRYLEGYDGARIENPVSFYPLGEYMIVESETQDGNTLYLYHPTLVGVDDLFESESILLSPNPSDGVFHLSLSEGLQNHGDLKVHVMTMDGKVMHEQRLLATSERIDLRNIRAGMYVLSVNSEGRTMATERIIVIK